jgi:exodeoxyribonuclease VII small subunit
MEQPTFRAAYDVLQKHAEILRQKKEPKIDDLLKIVTESVATYTVCTKRIDAVEEPLKAALEGTGVEFSAWSPGQVCDPSE